MQVKYRFICSGLRQKVSTCFPTPCQRKILLFLCVVVIQEETQESRQAGWESVEIDRNETHVS
jgi:hypothetical protein